MPSKDKSVIDNLNLSFSHPRIEKSDSTDAILIKMVAIQLSQKSLKISKRPSTVIAYVVSNGFMLTSMYASSADLNASSLR